MVEYAIRDVTDADAQQVVDIFNHFVLNSFAAYPNREVGLEFFHKLRRMAEGYPFLVVEVGRGLVGFALLRPYHSSETFKSTGVLTYFIMPEYTGLGLGSELLKVLVQAARARGIEHLLATISSRNEQSLRFHRKHGFVECGRLRNIGTKFGERFDVVWVQRSL